MVEIVVRIDWVSFVMSNVDFNIKIHQENIFE